MAAEQPEIAELKKQARQAEQENKIALANKLHRHAKQRLAEHFNATTRIERAITNTLYEYERAITPQAGSLITSGYLRRAFKNGLIAAIDRTVGNLKPTAGFNRIQTLDQPELAFESVVLKYPQSFSPSTVQVARQRMGAERRYWWVNHKRTFEHEVGGGYLWSPKRNRGGARNRTYDNMTRAQPGELVFSYASGFIQAIGYVQSTARASKQPCRHWRRGQRPPMPSALDYLSANERNTRASSEFAPAAHSRQR